MKKLLIFTIAIFITIVSHAQIEPIAFIEESNYGSMYYVYDHKIVDDEFIIFFLTDDGFNRIPAVSRVDRKGNIIWSTINQYSKPLSTNNLNSFRLFTTEYGELFAILGDYKWNSKKRNIWKIDIDTGEIYSDNLHYSDFNSSYEILDYDKDNLISISRVDGVVAQDVNELVIFDKESNEIVKRDTIEGPYEEVTIGIDDINNVYIGKEDKLTKYSSSSLDQPIWELTIENVEEIAEITFDENGELFVFTQTSGNSGYVHRIDRHTGEIFWTTWGSMSGTDVALSDFVDDSEYIYVTYRHIFVGSVVADFQAAKIRKSDGELIWKDKHILTLADAGEEPNGNNAAALALALDCDNNLYLTGYFADENYGPAICGIVKVDGVDGTKVWDQTLTLIPDMHDSESVGLAISIINDTLIVLPRLQKEDGGFGVYAAGLDIENGDIYYLNEINSGSCEFSSVSDLTLLGESFVAASIVGKDVKSIEYTDTEAIENVAIEGKTPILPGYIFSDEFSHCLTAYSIIDSLETTSIFINNKVNSADTKRDTIIVNSLNSRPLEIDGEWSYRTILYGVENEIYLNVYLSGESSDLELLLEEDVSDALDGPKRNTLLIENNFELMYLSKDGIDVYDKSDLSLLNSLDYPSALNAYNHVIVDDTLVCIVGSNANGNIGLLMMDFTTGEIFWQVDTELKGKAYQVQYDQSNGLYVSGVSEDHMYLSGFNKINGELLWTFNNTSITQNTIPMETAIIPDRNTIGIAAFNDQNEENSDGLFIILSLQGDVIHVEQYQDELQAKSAINTVIAGNDYKYYFGGSHNTVLNGKRGVLYSANFTAIDDNLGIFGIVFFDENQNGIKDSDELGMPNVKIQVDPIPGYTLTNADGDFFKLASEGEYYTVSTLIDTSNFTLTTDSISYSFNYSSSNPQIGNNEFGYFTDLENKVSINLTSNPTRCNTDSRFYIKILNEGFLLESGKVTLDFDPTVEYLSSSIEPSEYLEDEHQLSWEVNNLLPFDEKYITIDFKMPDENSTGEVINFEALVVSDDLETLDEYNYTPTVLCSYDPNDKLVMPPGVYEQNYTLFGDSILTYTVRFQNTGNAAAIDVVIRDTIDQNFDMNTFKVVNSSHNLRTNVDGHFVEFIFEDIYLIDSLTNEPESHGQVTFEIKVVESILNNILVQNTASIYFDFNPPIVTNTIQNMMVDMLPTYIQDANPSAFYSLHPNPTKNEINIVNEEGGRIDKIQIYDASGVLRISSSLQQINTNELSPGYYFVQILSRGNSTMLSFVKI